MAPEAIFAISIATVRDLITLMSYTTLIHAIQEEFLKKLIQAGQRQAVMEGRQAIHYSDICT